MVGLPTALNSTPWDVPLTMIFSKSRSILRADEAFGQVTRTLHVQKVQASFTPRHYRPLNGYLAFPD